MLEVPGQGLDSAAQKDRTEALDVASFHSSAPSSFAANSGQILGGLARELLFKPYSPGLWCAFGMLLGCGKELSPPRLSQETVAASHALSTAATELSSTVSIDRLHNAVTMGPERLQRTLEKTTQWKQALDLEYASFTNALSQQIVEYERGLKR
jgi:hypothetical protein